jgi:hypothetical protein
MAAKLQLSQPQGAEITYHFIGDDPHILSNGEPSVVIRRDSDLLKIDLYKGLYCIVSDTKWLCCVHGCANRNPDNPVAMSVDSRITKKSPTCIGNFIKHLNTYHPAYLSKVDISSNTYKIDTQRKRVSDATFFGPIGKKCDTSDKSVSVLYIAHL